MNDFQFINSYLQDLSGFLMPNDKIVKDLVSIRDLLLVAKNNNKNIFIFGNGGSASIASHISVDLTKNAGLRCFNFNEANLITCFANDYGFDNWINKAIKFYGEEGDVLIAISSSGASKNIINSVSAARESKFHSVITLTGFAHNNPLSTLGDKNLWIDSTAYNFVESVHQVWLLAIVDLLIGKREYSA